jgi:ABC-type nitrate/sulfonate/bicarbonate transport system substrate-binding protein
LHRSYLAYYIFSLYHFSLMEKITIGITPAISHLLILAKERGFFAEHGLDVQFRTFLTGKKSIKALQEGWVDMTTVIDTNIAHLALEKRVKINLLNCSQSRTDNLILARADQGITSAQSLKGKKLGYMKGTSSHTFIVYFCRKYGFELEDFELCPLSIDDMQRELLRGHIDACSLWQPFATNTLVASGHERISLNTIPNDNIMDLHVILAANSKFLNNNADKAQSVISAMNAAKSFANQAPEDAIATIANFIDVPAPLFAQIYEDIHFRMEPIPEVFWEQVALQVQWITQKPRIETRKLISVLKS